MQPLLFGLHALQGLQAGVTLGTHPGRDRCAPLTKGPGWVSELSRPPRYEQGQEIVISGISPNAWRLAGLGG